MESRIRRWVQNPRKILSPYIDSGMTVLDFGCGPGFFSLDMADMVGDSGKDMAADLQVGMLAIVENYIRGTELAHQLDCLGRQICSIAFNLVSRTLGKMNPWDL